MTDVQAGPGGALEVWAVTDWPGAAACPDCGALSDRPHETVLTRPRDVRRAGDPVDLRWVKRRRKCADEDCQRKTFTERLPQVPPRCRVTARLREQAAREIAERGITPAEAARHAGLSWPTVHDAFAARADRVLDRRPRRWRTWGSTSTGAAGPLAPRTGRPGSTCSSPTGGTPASTTCPGSRACSGQVEGRTADDAAYWLAGAAPAWRDAVRVVAIDMCTIYASAVRRMLPGAVIAVDLFHVVQLAVKTVGDVRRRAVRDKYGRRGRSGDPEYGIKNLLVRNLENLSPAQFAKIIETLDADGHGQQIALAWIAKEKLRDALNLRARVTGSAPCERQVRDRLFAFYDWCAQNEAIPELLTLARTISRWEDEIVAAVLTGVTNATSESLNRLAKLEARLAYGFRNPANQRRRVRIACTRGTRRNQSRTATGRRTRPVSSGLPNPG